MNDYYDRVAPVLRNQCFVDRYVNAVYKTLQLRDVVMG